MKLNEKPLHELLELIDSDQIAVSEIIDDLTRAVIERDSEICAFLEVAPSDQLKQQAQEQNQLPLRGLPIAIKDLISTEGFKTTCGSQFLRDFEPVFDATAITSLKDAGATIQGKLNLDEFGMGSSNENSGFRPTRNPVDLERVPGGSSGGSAAAVAANMSICALGTDTGGSVRLPASFCGVVGLKPTYGLVSRSGLVSYASSLDTIGPVTKNVRDAAILLNIISGHDPLDSTSVERSDIDYVENLDEGISELKIGIVTEFIEKLYEAARDCFNQWVRQFESLGACFSEISLPHCEYAIPTYYLISAAEASANLARYDGMRYGHRASNESLAEMYEESRSQGFGPEVKRRIILGTYALSAGYAEEWYEKAQCVRSLILSDFQRAFAEVDLILTPTSPEPAFKIGEKMADPLSMYLTDQFLVPVSLAGLCGISIPGGEVDGLPFGLQLIANRFEEDLLLKAAYAYEQSVL